MQLTFEAGTRGGMTGNLAESAGWRRAAGGAGGGARSLSEGVFLG